MNNKKSWWKFWAWFTKEETLPDPPKPKYLSLPTSDYPAKEDWSLETHQEIYLRKLDAYYFYQIVLITHAFASGKESEQKLIQLTAKHALIKQLLEN